MKHSWICVIRGWTGELLSRPTVETRPGWHQFDIHLGSSLIGWRSHGEGSHYRLLFWYLLLSFRCGFRTFCSFNWQQELEEKWCSDLLSLFFYCMFTDDHLCLVNLKVGLQSVKIHSVWDRNTRNSSSQMVQNESQRRCQRITKDRDETKSMPRFLKHQIRGWYESL